MKMKNKQSETDEDEEQTDVEDDEDDVTCSWTLGCKLRSVGFSLWSMID